MAKISPAFKTIYTNSIIYLPEEDFNFSSIVKCYRSATDNNQNNQKIFINFSKEYNCNPLDANCYIHINIQEKGEIKKTYVYGPVLYDNFLTSHPFTLEFNINIILNKNILHQASLLFCEDEDTQFVIQSSGETLNFSKNFVKQNLWTNFQMCSKDPNALLINIKSIRNYFMEFIKKLQVPVHFGDHLKLIFQNKNQKNKFLFSLKQWRFDEKVQKEQMKQSSSISQDFANIFGVDVYQEVISPQVDAEIIGDMYQIVYTPVNSIKNFRANNFSQLLYKDNVVQKSIVEDKSYEDEEEGEIKLANSYYQRKQQYQQIKQKVQENNSIQRICSETLLTNNPQKIQNLIKMNNYLNYQNKILKQQNNKLRSQIAETQRRDSTKQSEQLKEVKSMMKEMNERMILLEQRLSEKQKLDEKVSQSKASERGGSKKNYGKCPNFLKKDRVKSNTIKNQVNYEIKHQKDRLLKKIGQTHQIYQQNFITTPQSNITSSQTNSLTHQFSNRLKSPIKNTHTFEENYNHLAFNKSNPISTIKLRKQTLKFIQSGRTIQN